ncbi:monoheme cytochrome C [Nibrella saemangeumensis]|uniref:Monoheme cytochrome C n=1 Tax=Nibrella saemangeumensis TaxID=1084526 RepID=A0ABP8MY28_9BACT
MILADSLTKDPDTGLVVAEQLNVVKAHCTSCHSSKLILQNRFTRDGWKEKIRWMQRTQNLWDLRDSEPVVLDYLAKYYGPEQKAFDGRRKPLPGVQWYKL